MDTEINTKRMRSKTKRRNEKWQPEMSGARVRKRRRRRKWLEPRCRLGAEAQEVSNQHHNSNQIPITMRSQSGIEETRSNHLELRFKVSEQEVGAKEAEAMESSCIRDSEFIKTISGCCDLLLNAATTTTTTNNCTAAAAHQPEAEVGADRLLRERLSVAAAANGDGDDQQTRRPLDFIKHQHKHHHRRASGGSAAGSEHRRSHRPRRNHASEPSGFYDPLADRPAVMSSKGLVRGVTQKIFTGKFVDAFLGIPYAKPPVGEYRFRHPQPTDPWAGELDASKLPNSCYQVNDTFFGANFLGTIIWNANTPLSEDCLYLNIWTPFGVANTTVAAPSPATSGSGGQVNEPPSGTRHRSARTRGGRAGGGSLEPLRPVLVWIFGGGFYSGSSSLAIYEGGALASEEDIIVISMNYRVSSLGFLYFGRPEAPGNAGLFDQLLALQWVQDNAEQFGGDPQRVTIFGESAGAVSVAFHLLSPLSRSLFSQAILQSGAATCPWGYMDRKELLSNGLQLANILGCPGSNGSDLEAVVRCLRQADPWALVSQEVDQTKSILNFPFVPVVDGAFLLESPIESLMKSNFKRARILLGSNHDEGNAFLIYLPEFSQCPPGGEFGTGSGSSLPLEKEKLESAPGSSSSSSPDAGAGSGELGDQPPAMESMDLLASGRQMTPAGEGPGSGSGAGVGRQLGSQHNHSPSQQQSSGDSLQSSSAQQQPGSNSNSAGNSAADSQQKSCKPNEIPALSRDDFLRVLREDLNPYAEHPVGKEAIVFEYSNWNNPQDSVSNYDALDKIVGDYYFTCHVNEFAQRYAMAGNPVYMYYFRQRSSISPWPKWMGVLHADEINFVFGEPLNTAVYNYTAREVELSRRMMRYWGNFAKFGNPTKLSENSSMHEKWPEYANNKQYLELQSDLIRVGRGPRSKQCAFWSQYLPKLIESYDRAQCPANQAARVQHKFPPTSSSQLELTESKYNNDENSISGGGGSRFSSSSTGGLLNLQNQNLPSLVIVILSVILVLAIVCLLIYAKRSGKLELNLSSGSNQGHSSSSSN